MRTFCALVFLLAASGAVSAEEPDFSYRELHACRVSTASGWVPAKIKARSYSGKTTIQVDVVFNCTHAPKNPSVLYSPVSITLGVEETGGAGAMCLCTHALEFTLPYQVDQGKAVYFLIDGRGYGHASVR